MILTCGDALFDVFANPSSSSSSIALDARVGGSPLNVAVALSRLGQSTAFFSKVSTDPFGRRLIAYLESERIDVDLIVRTNAPTTLAIVALDDKGVPTYSFYTSGTADRSLEGPELPARLPDAVRVVHIGSYTTALEPTASSLEALVSRERARRFISYDPNIRPSIVPDPELWRRRVAALTTQAHLVKASVEDIEFLYPGASVESVLADWLARGAGIAIATMGEVGAMAATKQGVAARVSARAVKVIDTVGAGDTFQAALLTWLAEHGSLSPDGLATLSADDLNALLTFAARAASITCSRRGADMPRRSEL
ncbi:carbohydrate kinase family protein [Dongia deserti]|uniref:carbohydrate kinase family protein n=1 Tax=Dongia deserti TaxID=2268030 RepID=UPI000E648017|nr:carbohydrate kinase [Dongia deserti]